MAQRFAPATPKFPHMLHGGDYNPDQWLDQPEVLEEDIRLFRKAHINCVSLGKAGAGRGRLRLRLAG